VSPEYQSLLIVDDQPGVRRLLFEMLGDEGYLVDMAGSGAEAIRKVSARIPALVLLDAKMPGMSGIETLEEIKKIAPDVPVVMMTAYGELELLAESKKHGSGYYIKKPFDLEEIRFLIKEILAEESEKKLRQAIGQA
jgi:two-component system response regulator (stage 0 sporulation protein F)